MALRNCGLSHFLAIAKSAMRRRKETFLLDEGKKVRWKSDPAVSIHPDGVCMETSMDQARLTWVGRGPKAG